MKFYNTKKLSREEQFLFKVFCLSPEADDEYREHLKNSFVGLDEKRLWRLSLDSKVTAVFSHKLAGLLGWENIAPQWKEFHDAMADQVNFYCEEISVLARKLSTVDIKVIALKNDSITLAFPVCRGCCPTSDIDILIEKTHQQQADVVLEELGYKHYWSENSRPTPSEGSTGYFKETSFGQFIFLDVHWEAIGVRWMKGNLGELTSEMAQRAREIPGTRVFMFSPEDNLFQAVLHNAKHAYRLKPGFMRNLDVHRIIENQQINWAAFLDLIHTQKVTTAAYFSLLVPKKLFGTKIPDKVLTDTAPASWKKPLSGFVQSAWFLNSNKTILRSFFFRIVRVMLYDDLKTVISNSIISFWRRRRRWRLFYQVRNKILGFFSKKARNLTKFSVVFTGSGTYKQFFKKTGYGVVFEDDGNKGYFYTVKEDGSKIFQGLKLYDHGDPEMISEGDILEILWHPLLKKVGVKYHGKVKAVFDLKKQTVYSRTGLQIGFPLTNAFWHKSKSHSWDDRALSGF